MKPFLNTPWRVERSPGEILVVDSKNIIVAAFDISEPDDLPGEIADEEAKAHLLAGAPALFTSLTAFLGTMADPEKCQDETLVMKQLDELHANANACTVPAE